MFDQKLQWTKFSDYISHALHALQASLTLPSLKFPQQAE